MKNPLKKVDMNEIVGKMNILFVCLDTLRFDVATEEEKKGGTPNINKYGEWEKRHAPGNFTYPSHHAMFSGFLPTPVDPSSLMEREYLFFSKNIGMGRIPPKGAFTFEGPNFVQGLEKVGYDTICIGGVSFFDKRSDLGKVFPAMFKESYWNPSFACPVKESFDNQIEYIKKVLDKRDEKVFMYVNVDTIHYPNNFYLEGVKKDNIETHASALRYVDERVEKLFDIFRKRGETFVILCSDHGTCYGEDGYYSHRVSNETVYTVPYKHFII